MHRKGEGLAPAGAPWTRGAVVALWLIALVLAGGALAVRWDALIGELSGAPQASAGALR